MKLIVISLLSAALLMGCSQQRFVVMPAFTDISHIESLKLGMSKSDVSSNLEVGPIDFYYLQDGVDVYVYNYRLTEKRVPITNSSTRVSDENAVQNDHIDGLAARKAGTPHYTEWRKLYVSFKGDKLAAMITDSGKEDANAVLLQLASVQAITNDPQIKLVPRITTDHNYVIPLNDKGQYITNNAVVTGTGTNQTVIGGCAEIAVLPKQETTRSETVIFKRGKKNKRHSR